MAAISHSISYEGTYSSVDFFTEQDQLCATIDTGRLHIRSVTPDDRKYSLSLYSDPVVTEKFCEGGPWPRERVDEQLQNIWLKNWREHTPYSGFSIFKEDAFLGHIEVTPERPGAVELGYLLHQPYWGSGYTTEAALAIVKDYLPATIEAGYTLQGRKVEKLVATARVDNPASCRILDQKLGMRYLFTQSKYGALRNFYELPIRLPTQHS